MSSFSVETSEVHTFNEPMAESLVFKCVSMKCETVRSAEIAQNKLKIKTAEIGCNGNQRMLQMITHSSTPIDWDIKCYAKIDCLP